ncbi:MAG TPA: UbiA family prenyltransferase [Pyrinomonadaceae bacterium]|nr:UbiA family prenyltransferase [Pyrinomonadaceae bacterium]
MLTNIIKLTRWNEWGYSKIPLFFAAGNIWLLNQNFSTAQTYLRFGSWITFVVLLLAYGYALNDFCDKNDDKIAGKQNFMNEISSFKGAASLVCLVFVAVFALIPFYQEKRMILTAAINILLATAYSLPPVRFKERGVGGLLVSSMAQRSLPLFVGIFLFHKLDAASAVLIVLFTLIGIRWIILHQLVDLPKDIESDVHTFTRQKGYYSTMQLMKKIVFPLEIVCLFVWLILIARNHSEVLLIIPIYGVWLLIKFLFWRGKGKLFNWNSYWLHPLGDFYEIILPVFLGVILIFHHHDFILLFFLQIAWMSPFLLKQIRLSRKMLRNT